MKIFLHKSLTKSLSKVFLLVVLFLSGCSVADMLYVASGRSGTYSIDDVKYTFTISDDGKTYTSYYAEVEQYTLKYMSSSDYFVEYGDWVDEYDTYITVALTDIGEFNGEFNEYHGESLEISVGFSWNIYIYDYSD